MVKPNDKTSDTNDDVSTKTNTVHMKRDTRQVSAHVVFLLVRVVVIFNHCAPRRVAQGLKGPRACTHLIHARSERCSSTLSSPFSFNFPLERKLLGNRLAGLLRERQLEKASIEHGWDKISSWECVFVHRKQGLFLSGARRYVELREGH